jgi:hypothetical protein
MSSRVVDMAWVREIVLASPASGRYRKDHRTNATAKVWRHLQWSGLERACAREVDQRLAAPGMAG